MTFVSLTKGISFSLNGGEDHSIFNQNIISAVFPNSTVVGCLYFLFFCKVSETILGGKAWKAPPETCINRMACLDGLCDLWKPPTVGSYSMLEWPYLWKCYFNHLEMCYPFLISCRQVLFFLVEPEAPVINQQAAWTQELILRQGNNGHWFLNKFLSTQNTVWHFCSQWFYLHQVRPRVQIKCRTAGWGVDMHENPSSTMRAQSLGPRPAVVGKERVS